MTEFIFQFLAAILGWYLKKKAKTEQSQRDLIAYTQIMHRSGLASVKMRLEAANQIDRVDQMWEEELKERKEDGF